MFLRIPINGKRFSTGFLHTEMENCGGGLFRTVGRQVMNAVYPKYWSNSNDGNRVDGEKRRSLVIMPQESAEFEERFLLRNLRQQLRFFAFSKGDCFAVSAAVRLWERIFSGKAISTFGSDKRNLEIAHFGMKFT